MGKKRSRALTATDTPPLALLERLAIQAARAGGARLKAHFGKKIRVSEKPGAGLVTNADLESERAILKILRGKGPREMGFLTEESAMTGSAQMGASKASLGRWVVDPLDGTTNFVHAFPMFCVSIAAEWQGELVTGAIYHPILNDLYVATRGKGARLNGKRISVSQRPRVADSLLTTGFTYRRDEWLRAEMEAFEKLSQVARAIRRPGSAALDLAYVARGVFDGFWEHNLSPWDTAAGALLVQEAGGRVTDFGGAPFRIEMSQILATNQLVHSEIMQSVNRIRSAT